MRVRPRKGAGTSPQRIAQTRTWHAVHLYVCTVECLQQRIVDVIVNFGHEALRGVVVKIAWHNGRASALSLMDIAVDNDGSFFSIAFGNILPSRGFGRWVVERKSDFVPLCKKWFWALGKVRAAEWFWRIVNSDVKFGASRASFARRLRRHVDNV